MLPPHALARKQIHKLRTVVPTCNTTSFKNCIVLDCGCQPGVFIDRYPSKFLFDRKTATLSVVKATTPATPTVTPSATTTTGLSHRAGTLMLERVRGIFLKKGRILAMSKLTQTYSQQHR